jgi:hypothetical protein
MPPVSVAFPGVPPMSKSHSLSASLIARVAERHRRRRRRRTALVHNEAARALRSPGGVYRRRVVPSARRYRRHPRHRLRAELALDGQTGTGASANVRFFFDGHKQLCAQRLPINAGATRTGEADADACRPLSRHDAGVHGRAGEPGKGRAEFARR